LLSGRAERITWLHTVGRQPTPPQAFGSAQIRPEKEKAVRNRGTKPDIEAFDLQ
jgi:hypothetical protein